MKSSESSPANATLQGSFDGTGVKGMDGVNDLSVLSTEVSDVLPHEELNLSSALSEASPSDEFSSNTLQDPHAADANKKNKFFIKTFGCQMNVADTERMQALMSAKGMTEVKEATEAGVIIINGCTVREKAVHKAVSTLGQYRHRIEVAGFDKPIVGIGGCVGQLEKEELFRKAPYVDFVFGTDAIDQLPELLSRVEHGEKHLVAAEFDNPKDNYSTETKVFGAKAAAFVNIMKGCDKYCTYCIVPFTRGKEKSRTIREVVADIARLVATGVREVTLLGQNVNSFGKGNPNTAGLLPLELHNRIGKVGPNAGEENFPQLLRAIDTDPRCAALKRIRFTSSHPLDFSDELIDCYQPAAMGGVARLAPHLHLPVQSGSNRMLAKMGRKHKIEDYIAQMDRLREMNPEISFSTDLIVGFPTETEEEFQETMKLLDRLQYDNIFAFAYSPRPGTRAAKLPDDVSKDEKNRRLNELLNHQLKISERLYASRIGRVMEVMVESEAKKQTMVLRGTAVGRVWAARTGCGRPVNFADDSGRNLNGKFLKVEITKSTPLSLTGKLIHDASEAERPGLARTSRADQSTSAPTSQAQTVSADSSEFQYTSVTTSEVVG